MRLGPYKTVAKGKGEGKDVDVARDEKSLLIEKFRRGELKKARRVRPIGKATSRAVGIAAIILFSGITSSAATRTGECRGDKRT